jgi:hypothetical protein
MLTNTTMPNKNYIAEPDSNQRAAESGQGEGPRAGFLTEINSCSLLQRSAVFLTEINDRAIKAIAPDGPVLLHQ